MSEISYIRDTASLAGLCDRAAAAGRLGIDTEFVRERTYYPKLALVQVNVAGEVVLIDPLERLDLAPLLELVSDPSVCKIFHAATQDLEIFAQLGDELPAGVFDTQVAAALCGMGLQASYAAVVQSVLGVELSKAQQYTDWLRRPLSDSQEVYAAADVAYLLQLQDELGGRVAELGRAGALTEELDALVAPARFEITPASLVKRVKGSRNLKPRQRAAMERLAIWREEEAQRRDVPRRWVVADDTLAAIARALPTTSAQLARTRGLHPKEASRSARAILRAVQEGMDAELPVVTPQPKRRVPDGADSLVDFVKALVRSLCRDADVAPGMVGSSGEIEALVLDFLEDGPVDDNPLMRGWRGAIIGESVRAFLTGRMSVRFSGGSLSFTEDG